MLDSGEGFAVGEEGNGGKFKESSIRSPVFVARNVLAGDED